MRRRFLIFVALLVVGCGDSTGIPPEGYHTAFPTNTVFFDILWDDGSESWFDATGLALSPDLDGERIWTTDVGPCKEIELQPTGMRELGESWLVELEGTSVPHTCTWVSQDDTELTATVRAVEAEWTTNTFELHMTGRLTADGAIMQSGSFTAEFYGSRH